MTTRALLDRYAYGEDGEARTVFEGCTMPDLSPIATRLYYAWEERREQAAHSNPVVAFPNNEKGDLYQFLLGLWAEAIMGEDGDGIHTVEVVEEAPTEPHSRPVIVINGMQRVPVLVDYETVVPELAACLMAALNAQKLHPLASSTPLEDYDVEGGSLRIERGDTPHGNALPVRIILELASV